MKETEATASNQLYTREEWQQQLLEEAPSRAIANPSFAPSEYLDVLPDGKRRHPKVIAQKLRLIFSRIDEERGKELLLKTSPGPDLEAGKIRSRRRAKRALADIGISEYLGTRAKNVDANRDEIINAWSETVHLIKAGLTKGRTLGYIPEWLDDEQVNTRLESVAIQLRDPLLADRAVGLYALGEDLITLQGKNPADKLRTLVHELRHRMSGGTFKKTGGLIYRRRAGFQQPDKAKKRLLNSSLDEAVNEHITMSIINGNWDVIDPVLRGDGAYWIERRILSSLITRSKGLIDLKTITQASFEDTTPQGGVAMRREMVSQFHKAYRLGTIKQFDTAARLLNDYYDKYGDIPSGIRGFIVPPLFNSSGNVVRKGYIDLAHLDYLLREPKVKKIIGDPLL